MYFTTRAAMAEDLVSGVKWVEDAEKKRRRGTLKGRQEEEDVKVILVAHSAGGALSQYVLSRGMIKVSGFCMCAAVPGFGS
jgi:alpha-beta hydrolase superfamily lysophospholipase